MRIAQIVDVISFGGAEKQLVVFAALARQRGQEVTTICLVDDGHPTYENDLLALNSQVVHFHSHHLFDFKRFSDLAGFLHRGRFDVVHTHLAYGNIIGACAARMAGSPVVSSLHSTGRAGTTRTRLREMIETLSLRLFPQRIIAVGYKVEEANRDRFGRKKMNIVQNAVMPGPELSAERRQALRRELAGDLEGPILITAARFVTPKAPHHMVSAFAQIAGRFPQAVLVMVGDGQLFPEIQAQVAELGLTKRIHLPGSRSDVPELLAAADIYVSSSIWEGLPMSILEAMIAGLPVIATGVGDIPRVVTSDAGLIVPPAQPEALAEAMARLLDDPALCQSMGAAARRHSLAEFSADVWMDRILALYREVIEPSGQKLAPV